GSSEKTYRPKRPSAFTFLAVDSVIVTAIGMDSDRELGCATTSAVAGDVTGKLNENPRPTARPTARRPRRQVGKRDRLALLALLLELGSDGQCDSWRSNGGIRDVGGAK